MTAEIEVLKAFYAAINRNDMNAMTDDFDPAILRTEPSDFPAAGTYRGLADVRAHVTKGRGTWAEGSCDPESFHVNGKRVVVFLHVRVRLNGATGWIDGRFADGFAFKRGKIIEYHTFGERSQALEWAGLTEAKGAT